MGLRSLARPSVGIRLNGGWCLSRALIGYSTSGYSLIHLQLLRVSHAKLAEVTSKMASRFAAITNKEISQIIKGAVPETHEDGEEIRFGSFNR